MFRILLISLAFAAFAHSAVLKNGVEIPVYATVCHRNDPDLDDCLKGSIETSFHKIAKKGIKGVSLPSLDPLVIEELSGGFKGPGYDFNHAIRDTSIRGLNKIKFLSVRSDLTDPEDMTLELDFAIPEMRIRGAYKVEGLIATVSLGGRGPFTVNATDIRGTTRLSAHLIEVDGVQYMKVHKVEMAPTIATMKSNFANLIDGNPELSEAANLFFNNFWLPAYEGMLPYSMDMFDKVFRRLANQALLKIPYDQLIPE